MALIRDAATAAAALAQQREEAALQAARDVLVAQARSAVEALPAPDGTTPLSGRLKDDKVFPVRLLDLGRRIVVLSDGDLTLGRFGNDLFVVELIDGAWTRRSEKITTLAQLGKALVSG